MLGRPQVIIAVLALLVAVSPALAADNSVDQYTVPTTDEQSRDLAQKLVSAEAEADDPLRNFAYFELSLASFIQNIVAPGDTKARGDLATEVHEKFAPLKEVFRDALLEGYAESLNPNEMREIIGFLQSPGGLAEKANLPLLKTDLANGLMMDPNAAAKMEARSEDAFKDAPQTRRDLIVRILKAQNLEERTRQGLRKHYSTMSDALSVAGNGDGGPQEKGSDTKSQLNNDEVDKQIEADVRRTMAIERSFYLTHYSDKELNIIANYLESDAGKAVMTQLPMIRQKVGNRLIAKLEDELPGLFDAVCASKGCSSAQREKLNLYLKMLDRIKR